MVAMYEDDFTANPKTLCDWVKNFRVKKIQMKRKFRGGGELRVCALLSTALMSAEHELRRKQQERFNRWLEMQAKLNDSQNGEQRDTGNNNNNNNCGNERVVVVDIDYVNKEKAASVAEEQIRREEVTSLWKYELSGLDEFMRNISSSSKCHELNIVDIPSSNGHCEIGNSLSNNCAIEVAS